MFGGCQINVGDDLVPGVRTEPRAHALGTAGGVYLVPDLLHLGFVHHGAKHSGRDLLLGFATRVLRRPPHKVLAVGRAIQADFLHGFLAQCSEHTGKVLRSATLHSAHDDLANVLDRVCELAQEIEERTQLLFGYEIHVELGGKCRDLVRATATGNPFLTEHVLEYVTGLLLPRIRFAKKAKRFRAHEVHLERRAFAVTVVVFRVESAFPLGFLIAPVMAVASYPKHFQPVLVYNDVADGVHPKRWRTLRFPQHGESRLVLLVSLVLRRTRVGGCVGRRAFGCGGECGGCSGHGCGKKSEW